MLHTLCVRACIRSLFAHLIAFWFRKFIYFGTLKYTTMTACVCLKKCGRFAVFVGLDVQRAIGRWWWRRWRWHSKRSKNIEKLFWAAKWANRGLDCCIFAIHQKRRVKNLCIVRESTYQGVKNAFNIQGHTHTLSLLSIYWFVRLQLIC